MGNRFDDTFLSDVRERSDIVELVGRHVKLKKAGKDYTALCPFHTEKSPSFTVSAIKQFYHCFGCGAHGSVFSFLMEHGGLTFVEAVEELAHSAGIRVPERVAPSPLEQAEQSRRSAMVEVLTRAATLFHQNLRATPDAVIYLKSRGFKVETILQFGIGYASQGIVTAIGAAPLDLLKDVGLVVVNDDTGECRDKFRQRIMFPIRNERGDVIGFGGRVLDAREPKYLNSPESVLFHKGEELFGLHLAKQPIRQGRIAVVVEGYMDVAMLWQHGEPRAVAALGTSLTADQLGRLYRLCDHVVFCFDGDKAGQKASDRAAHVALGQMVDGKTASFVTLPGDHDPDSYLREYGIEAWRDYVENQALPLSGKLIEMLKRNRDLAVPEDRAAFARDGVETLQTILHAPTFRDALKTEIERLASMNLRLRAQTSGATRPDRGVQLEGSGPATGTVAVGSVAGPQPTSGRDVFYRRYGLLMALDVEAGKDIPAALLDEFSELIAGWFACAAGEAQTRQESAQRIRDAALRAVVQDALRRCTERTAMLDAEALSRDVDALVVSISGELAQRALAQQAAELFR
ncbi:DNA primase [Paraburkholderia domus]|uniref:DNA primase n=1 Tax=Paraburkholderia domus TaxID=2793075 RepID=UPI001911B60D|nr:DNA primase [Paraburkholderia domus]MBK5052909.1 DNA primase [Burkholderia sp. R-70006]CAE6822641.1 DNA primase [Paraburkholderia domus]